MAGLGAELTIDPQDLRGLERKLGAELMTRVVGDTLETGAKMAAAEIMRRTPARGHHEVPGRTWVRTGNLRRSIQINTRNAHRWPSASAEIHTETVYAWWIEKGTDRRGRKMKVRPGGYRMFEEGMSAVDLEALLDGAVKALDKEWSKT